MKCFYKLMYQIIEQINIIRNLKFAHQDIHLNNIMYDGKNFHLIDYGNIGICKQKYDEFMSDLTMFIKNAGFTTYSYPTEKVLQKIQKIEIKSVDTDLFKKLNKPDYEIMFFIFCLIHHPEEVCRVLKWPTGTIRIPDEKFLMLCIKHVADDNYAKILNYLKRKL